MTIHRSAFWASISLIIALIALTAFDRGTAQAKIYKYRDDQGKIHFTNEKSSIPMKYRSGPQTEEIRGVSSPSSVSKPATPSSSGTSEGGTNSAPAETGGKPAGFSDADTKLAKDSIAMLQKGVDLAKEYKDLPNSSRIGKNLYNAIQANLPAKKSLVAKLTKSKVPALVSAHSLLQKTLASDQATPPIKPTMVRKIRSLMDRVVGEGPAQAAMIKKLNQAVKKMEKDKAEAEKKKGQEKKAGLPESKK